ncbi:HAD-IIB family hydrolase [Granulosicoccaceae sp. 1_MG-2023]|nr:HAD-IIB family hydrolase [Granulosicoccaceae sp. 1_MG-2023]
MPDPVLLCTDLDRTLLPNGAAAESARARDVFAALAARPELTLAYVSGRDLDLVSRAIEDYQLPLPDYIGGDVGTTLYHAEDGHWQRLHAYEDTLLADWNGYDNASLRPLLASVPGLKLQPESRQNRCKLSYFASLDTDPQALRQRAAQLLQKHSVRANLIYSVDETAGVGLLDILPGRASKRYAVEQLMKLAGFGLGNTLFSGDSGNDLDVMHSDIPSVLVANADLPTRNAVTAQVAGGSVFIAGGNLAGLNGNYSAGIVEGLLHFYPAWQTVVDDILG